MKLNRRVVWITPRPGELGEVYYLTDGLGSTMALTDEDGDVDTAWDYDVFGAVWATSGGQPNDFTFAGEQVDASTDLQYLRARYYDPEIGRFISKDRLAGSLFQPLNQNRYSYVESNPCNATDPSGLASESVVKCTSTITGKGFGRIPVLGSDFVPFGIDILFQVKLEVTFKREDGALRAKSVGTRYRGSIPLLGWDPSGEPRANFNGDNVGLTIGFNDYGRGVPPNDNHVQLYINASIDQNGNGSFEFGATRLGTGTGIIGITRSATMCNGVMTQLPDPPFVRN